MKIDIRPVTEVVDERPLRPASGIGLWIKGLAWLVGLVFWLILQGNQPQLQFNYSADQLTNNPPHWQVNGFFRLEVDGDNNHYFWTRERLEIQFDKLVNTPLELTFQLRSAATAGGPDAPVKLLVNGREVTQFRPEPHDQRFQTFVAKIDAPADPGQNLKIELVSQTFTALNGTEVLGTMVKSLGVSQTPAWSTGSGLLWLLAVLALLAAGVSRFSPYYHWRWTRYLASSLYLLGALATSLVAILPGQVGLIAPRTSSAWAGAAIGLALLFGLTGFGLLFSRPGGLNIYLLTLVNLLSFLSPPFSGRVRRTELQKRVQHLTEQPVRGLVKQFPGWFKNFFTNLLPSLIWPLGGLVALALWLALQFNSPQLQFKYNAEQLSNNLNYPQTIGFYKMQVDADGNNYFWTRERAGISYNFALKQPIDVVFELRSAAIAGGPATPLKLVVNGQVVGDIQPDPRNSKFQSFTAKIEPPKDNNPHLKIELISQTFTPPNDGRTLGIMVKSIELNQTNNWTGIERRRWLFWSMPLLTLLILGISWINKHYQLAWLRYANVVLCLVGTGFMALALFLIWRTSLIDQHIYPLWPFATGYLTLLFGLAIPGLLFNRGGKSNVYRLILAKMRDFLYQPFRKAALVTKEPELVEYQRLRSILCHSIILGLAALLGWSLIARIPLISTFAMVLILLNLTIFAYILAFCFMHNERRLLILLPFGLLVGSCLYGYGVIVNRYLFDLSIAIVAGNLELLALSLIIAWPRRKALGQFRPTFGFRIALNNLEVGLRIGMVVIILAVLTWLSWNYTMEANITEARIWHSALTTTLQRGNFPPVSPLEPDYPLIYRWTYHHQAASLGQILPLDTPSILGIFNVWVVVLLFWATIALLYRQNYTLIQAIGGGVIFLLAGTSSWLLDLSSGNSLWPYMTLDLDARRNYITAGSNFDMLRINPSILFGYFSLLATLWFWLEWQAGRKSIIGFLCTAVLIAYLNASNEVLVILFAGALGLYWLLKMVLSRRFSYYKQLLITMGLGLASLIFSLPLSTFITSALLDSTRTQGYKMSVNTLHLGSIPTPPLSGDAWVSLLSMNFLFTSGFIPLLLVVLMIGAWVLRSKLAPSLLLSLLLLMGFISFVASISFYPTDYPGDQYRFTQSWYIILGLGCYLGLVRQARYWRIFAGKLLYNALLLIVGSWIIPTILAALLQATYPQGSSQIGCVSKIDQEAALYLARQNWNEASRVITVNGTPDWRALYNCYRPETLSNIIMLQYGGVALPVGHTIYDHPKEYLPSYIKASTKLDLDALYHLKVDHLFINLNILDPVLKATLSRWEVDGTIQQVYNLDERIIYKLRRKV